MGDQPRRESTPVQPSEPPARQVRVPIARGADRRILERVIAALEHAGVPYVLEDQVAGEAMGTWQVLVPILQAPRALAALAALRSEAGAEDAPPEPARPGPLFAAQPAEGLRLILMLVCFAAAIWLALRS